MVNVVIEELKQRVTAKAERLRRYEQRVQQYRQNLMFEYDQKKHYKRTRWRLLRNRYRLYARR